MKEEKITTVSQRYKSEKNSMKNYANKLDNLEERNMILEIYNLARLTQEEIDNQMSQITSIELNLY